MTVPSMSLIPEAEYSAIEEALQSSAKGRRFLRSYVERNRSLESRRLLRSISRIHRVSLGAPGLNADVCRDLASVLKSVARRRQMAASCGDRGTSVSLLMNSLQDVESCLMALIESIEERNFEALSGNMQGFEAQISD